jgi:hypothetical protein
MKTNPCSTGKMFSRRCVEIRATNARQSVPAAIHIAPTSLLLVSAFLLQPSSFTAQL